VADDKTLSQTVCQNFSKDNKAEGIDFTATKAHWLSKVDYKKKVGSLVIWLKSKLAADYLLKSGTAIFGATGAYCSKWDLREKELPCFNCQKYGHKQAECKSAVKCAYCSRAHSRFVCPRTELKCPLCHASGHSSMDWQCPQHPNNWKYVGKQRELNMRKAAKEQGTTRISQEIIAKQNSNKNANEPERTQHATKTTESTLSRSPRTAQATPAEPIATPVRRQTKVTPYAASQPQTQEPAPATPRMNVHEIEMIDADSNASSDE